MHKRTTLLMLPWLAVLSVVFPAAFAFGATGQDKPDEVIREIFVPFEDLNVLLEGQSRRVLLTRDEYEELLKKAKKVPKTKAPQPVVLISADYTISIRAERAQLSGTLVFDVLDDGLQAVPLELSGVGLRKAALDGRGAAIGRAGGGRPALFVEGRGRHQLVLEMVAPVETTATSTGGTGRQVLNFRLPKGPAGSLRLTVPGDVEVRSGAQVVSRVVDEPAGLTRFELLHQSGDISLTMSLNSRLQRRERAVMARSVIVDEVTQAYERLHATVSLEILHQAVDHFRFVVPEGFEITDVASPLLARWSIQKEPERRVLEVRLRRQTRDTVVLNLSAVRTPAVLDDWTLPKLEPLEVVGQVAVVGLLVEERLKAESIAAAGLIQIDTAVLSQALPETIFKAEPGAPPLRAVVAYYAPQGDFSLKARFDKPPAEVAVTTAMLLILGQQRQEVRGGLALLPEEEKLFSLDFSVPAGWYVTSVTGPGEKPLEFERYGPLDGTGRVHVRLPQGVPPGQEYSINFHARATPTGWLSDWKSFAVEFPVFAVAGATRDVGVIAVAARDDITVRPKTLDKLTPLDRVSTNPVSTNPVSTNSVSTNPAEKANSGLAGVAYRLAYRYESRPYRATLTAERPQPRLTARTFSFIRVLPDALAVHYEITYEVEESRTRQLTLLLPKDTPETLSIRGLDGLRLKQYTSLTGDGTRRWTVLLAEPRRGTIRLAVDFQQPLEAEQPKDLPLPIVRAAGVAYQSGLVAVEGSAELDVRVKTAARRVDVGELVDAEYQPGRRLLGAFLYQMGFAGEPADVKISVFRHPGYRLDPAIVQKAALTTLLSCEGVSQTEAHFELRTKALYLEVILPPRSELWAADLDGKPCLATTP